MNPVKGWLARFATLRWRLILFYCGLLTLLIVGLGWFMYSRLENFLYDGVRTRLQDYALTQAVVPQGDGGRPEQQGRGNRGGPSQLQTLSNLLASKPSDEIYAAIFDEQGRFVTPTPASSSTGLIAPPPQPPQLRQATAQNGYFYPATLGVPSDNPPTVGQEDGLLYLQPIRDRNGPALDANGTRLGYVLVGASLKQAHQILQQMQFLLLIGLLGALGLAVLLGIPLARFGLRPLQRITEIARRTRSSNLTQRVSLPAYAVYDSKAARQDEVWQLAQEFNAMLDKIEAAFVAQKQSEARTRQFVADASHELRSPLTVLGGYVDVLLMGAKDDPARAERIIGSMRSEINRLSRLVVDLLMLTRLDAGGGTILQLTPVEADELLQRTVTNMTMLTGDRRLELKLSPEAGPVWVRGDADQLYRVLVNLVDNAIRYTSPQGHISLSLGVIARPPTEKVAIESEKLATRKTLPNPTQEWVVIEVSDDGCGIEAAQLPLIFDRFYRADESRARQTGNAGLGLAISKGIIEAHGGSITVESQVGQGTTFRLYLPVLGRELEVEAELPTASVQAS